MLYLDEASTSETVTVPSLTGLALSQVNARVAQAGLNLSITGAAASGSSAVADTQDLAEGTEVPPGTVITVNFVELEAVH